MTTTDQEKKKCSVCGKMSKYTTIKSTSSFGHIDLDTRPPDPQRCSIEWWIQRCPYCSYCSPDISMNNRHSAIFITNEEYQQQLTHAPELASSFLCYSLIEGRAGSYDSAGWACIHAAWVCDDDNLDSIAKECRMKAVAFLQKAKKAGQIFSTQTGGEELLLTDLMRRSGQFEIALDTCDKALENKMLEQFIQDILCYEKALICRKDVACHDVSEIQNS